MYVKIDRRAANLGHLCKTEAAEEQHWSQILSVITPSPLKSLVVHAGNLPLCFLLISVDPPLYLSNFCHLCKRHCM